MLNGLEFDQYCRKHKLTTAAREYIDLTRTSEPSRLVGTNATTNVCTWYASSKMQHTVQAESRGGELAYVLNLEYDNNVIEYWDQVPPITVTRTYKNGSKRPGSYTADFLVLSVTGPTIVEVKPEIKLKELIVKNSKDWLSTDSGILYRPAKEAFSNLGLSHIVKSNAELNPIRTANLRLLIQVKNEFSSIDPETAQSVKKMLKKYAWIRLSDLAKELQLSDYSPLLQMINQGILYASINEEILSQPESAWVASSPELLALSCEVRKQDCETNTLLNNNCPIPINIIPTEEKALQALKILERIKSGEKSRSVRRWKNQIAYGKRQGLTELQSLLPNTHLSGNYTRRLNPVVEKYLNCFIDEHYANPTRLKICAAHKKYRKLAKAEHPLHPPVTRTTLKTYIDQYNQQKIARGHGGRRTANAVANPSPVEHRDIGPTVPFELATMDHSLAKIKCIIASANGTTYTAQPWISALVDIFTKAILAVWISFLSPSTRSCAMLIRQCVRKHARVPSAIVVDRGSDFKSTYFYSLVAHCGSSLVQRPAEYSRYGSEVERLFGEFKTQWLNLRPGNMVNFKKSRAVSGSHAPANNAELSIEDLLNEFWDYIEWQNNNLIGNQSKSPANLLQEGLTNFTCVGQKIEEDYNFIVASAVDARKYKIDPARGIQTDKNIHYWHPDLAKLAGRGRKAEVRLEPEDPYRIYARIDDKWVTCLASGNQQFQAKDPISRLAEAIRINDCKDTRSEAKAEAEGALIQNLIKADEKLSAKKVLSSSPDPIISQADRDDSIFTKSREAKLPPLKTTTWRKK